MTMLLIELVAMLALTFSVGSGLLLIVAVIFTSPTNGLSEVLIERLFTTFGYSTYVGMVAWPAYGWVIIAKGRKVQEPFTKIDSWDKL